MKNGELISEHGINTIIGKYNQQTYRIGLSKGWNAQGDNHWIITAYKLEKSPDSDFLPSNRITKGDGTNLHPNDRVDTTDKPLNSDLNTTSKPEYAKTLEEQLREHLFTNSDVWTPKYHTKGFERLLDILIFPYHKPRRIELKYQEVLNFLKKQKEAKHYYTQVKSIKEILETPHILIHNENGYIFLRENIPDQELAGEKHSYSFINLNGERDKPIKLIKTGITDFSAVKKAIENKNHSLIYLNAKAPKQTKLLKEFRK